MRVQQQVDTIMQKNNSLVCVDLDSASARLPDHWQGADDAQFLFNKAIVDATNRRGSARCSWRDGPS